MRIYRSLGLAVAVGMVAAAMSPVAVHASQPDPVAANVLSALSSQTDQVLDSMWSSDVRNLSVENGRVTSTSNGGTQVQISLPGHPTMQELKGDLTTHVTSGDRFTSSVEDAGSGAFRALIHIPDNSAPREYRFEFGEENQLVPLEDGGVTIRDSLNNQVGSVAAPWAVDAQGQPVETKFEIDGSTLVQRVLFTSGTGALDTSRCHAGRCTRHQPCADPPSGSARCQDCR